MRRFYSSRLPWHTQPNRLSQLRERSGGYLDLTVSNPTGAGLTHSEAVLEALRHPQALQYQPSAAGLSAAREAVSAYYFRRGITVDPDNILLTASTSEAYSYLFKLLADPGDEILVPRPSYPLFDFLAHLESLTVRQYELHYDGSWFTENVPIGPHTRAVINVSPNNPTGSVIEVDTRGVPLIVDEVFADYLLKPRPRLLGDFTLNGLSKIAALPQMKLGWILYPPEYRHALELIADTYLSVSAPIQHAAPEWLAAAEGMQAEILARLRQNDAFVRKTLAGTALTPLSIDGGWALPIELPKIRTEEQWACDLLQHHGVLIQPGYFYDFPREAFIVVSLLTEPSILEEGLARIVAAVC